MHQPVQANDILEGSIPKALLRFFFPILLGTFFQQMYNTADAIIVGKFVGDEALAAVGGATGTIINLLVNFFVGLSSGSSVVLGQYFGARDMEGIHHTVHTAAGVALAFGLLLSLVGVPLSPYILKWMGLQQDVMVYAAPYIRIYFLGTVPSLIYNVGAGLLRAVGDSRRPMLFLIAACVTNVILDVLLVAGLNLGTTGAAIATVLSQVVSATLIVLTLTRSNVAYRLTPKKIAFHLPTLKKMMKIGFPMGVQSAMFGISNVIVQSSVNGFSTITLAGYTAYCKLDAMYWMVSSALGVSTTTFVAQNYGAGKLDRVRRGVKVCLLLYVVFIVLGCGFLLLLGKTLLGMFTSNPEVINLGYSVILQIVPFFFTYIFMEILNSTVRGTGDTLVPTILMVLGICVFRILWIAFVLPHNYTLRTLLWCYPISWATTSLMFLVYYVAVFSKRLNASFPQQG